jgi:integration host factor subunit alpha
MTAETVTRADLINKLTENNNFTRQQAAEILKKTLEEIEKALAKGEHVKISSFGTFSILQKKERIGRNPRTGKDAKISPRRVLSFRASPVFKKSVAGEVPLEKQED